MQMLAVKPDAAHSPGGAELRAAAAVVLRFSRAHQACRGWIEDHSVITPLLTCNILHAESL